MMTSRERVLCGEFGGAVMNPANALCGIIAALKDADGERVGVAELDGGQVQAAERLDQAETADLVEGQGVAGDGAGPDGGSPRAVS